MYVSLFQPDRGYRNDWLWLPRRRISNLLGIHHSLTFYNANGKALHAFSDQGDHVVVPREYIPYPKWESLPFPIEDRQETDFPELAGLAMRNRPRSQVQENGIHALLNGGSGILSLACGMGKTFASLYAWKELKVPGLVVVQTEDLEGQWRDAIVEHTNLTRQDIGTIRGPTIDWEYPITVASIQTLAKRLEDDEMPEEARNHFGVAIYDECHHLGAPYFNTTAAYCKGWRWGLSATPSRSDGLEMLYQYHLGPILYMHHEQDIIPDTWFLQSGVEITPEGFSKVRDRTGDIHVPKLTTWLSELQPRNNMIVSWVKQLVEDKRTALILSQRVEHLNELQRMLKGVGISTGVIHGDIKPVERRRVLLEERIILATQPLAREGLDRPDLDAMFLTFPVADEGLFEQILGRAQRALEGKRVPIILIMEDEKVKVLHEMAKRLRFLLTRRNYPFEMARAV